MFGALRRSAWRLAAVGLAVLIAPAPGGATAPAARVPGIGYLANEPTPDSIPVLRARLRELDWVEGRSLTIWSRYAQGKPDLYARHAEDLVRLNVAAIVAVGGPAIEAARQATKTVPIVMIALDDPGAAGAPRSPESAPTNLTGLSTFAAEGSARRLELLKQIVPGLARVAALWNSASPGAAADLRATQDAARAGGLEVVSVEIRGEGDVREAFTRVQAQAPQGLIVLSDALVLAHRQRIASLASRARLPAIFPFRDFVDAGGLIAYGPAWPDVFDQVARFVDRILRGARPSDLPVARAGRSELVINLRAARALALTIPAPLLQRADRVIQ